MSNPWLRIGAKSCLSFSDWVVMVARDLRLSQVYLRPCQSRPAAPSDDRKTRLWGFCVWNLPQCLMLLIFHTQDLVLGVIFWEAHWQVWEDNQVVRDLETILYWEGSEKGGLGLWARPAQPHWCGRKVRPSRKRGSGCFQFNTKINLSYTNPATLKWCRLFNKTVSASLPKLSWQRDTLAFPQRWSR